MSLLDRKLLRDLRGLKSQALAVALVMACGLAMMIMTRSLILSLETARDTYYRDHRFAQVFAALKRAPHSVAAQLAAIPGVATVQTGIALQATLDLPGMAEPAVGLMQSLPERGGLVLNRLYLRRGHMIVGRGTPGEILVGEAFAEAHGLQPGDTLSAILYGRKQTFRIAGIVLSPAFIFEAPPGAALPDNRTYGVFWMPYRELAEASRLYGAFDHVAIALAPGAVEEAVIAAVDRVLQPYGGRGAYGRAAHPSHTRLRDEIRVLQGLSIGFPLVFLSVAAFMTNAVMSRQITLQREQIAMLKACGFSNRQVGWHYFKFALAIVVDSANRRRPSGPFRRPRPECFTPPIGASTLENVARYPSFTLTLPARRRAATRRPRARDPDSTEALSPNAESLAAATAASSESTTVTATTGPNVSCAKHCISLVTSVSTVGSTKYGPISGRACPPASTVAPFAIASSMWAVTRSSCASVAREPTSVV